MANAASVTALYASVVMPPGVNGMKRIEILTMGREILTGRTLDSNSHWIAGRVTEIGGEVKRIVCVDDDLDEISGAVSLAMGRGTKVLITTGGLGPTTDDMTAEGVAKAMGVTLEINEEALEFVREKYRVLYERGFVDSPEMTGAREKMAALPTGALWVLNNVGAAPGIWVESGGTTVFSVPGVPVEMQAMLTDHVLPYLSGLIGEVVWVVDRVSTGVGDESVLKPILDEVMAAISGVYMKSIPVGFGRDESIEVDISCRAEHEAEGREIVDRAKRAILDRLGSLGSNEL